MEHVEATKTVHFPQDDSIAQVVLELPSVDTFTKEDRTRMWYRHSDFRRLKATAKETGKMAERSGFGTLLTLEGDLDEVQENLRIWSRNGNYRRGLEMYVDRTHCAIRVEWKSASIEAVLRTQALLRSFRLDEEAMSRKIAETYSKTTGEPSQYAYMVGKADAFAALQEVVVSSSRRMLKHRRMDTFAVETITSIARDSPHSYYGKFPSSSKVARVETADGVKSRALQNFHSDASAFEVERGESSIVNNQM